MKPKNLKSPLTWEERRPIVHDRVLYVPEYYDRHHEWTFPGWESPDIFGRSAPIEVEFCAGNGLWILEKATAHPERNWVAVEYQFDRVRKIWSKIQNYSLKNLLVVCGEALTFTRFYAPPNSFDAAYVNFPDPWPKDRHARRRLLQEPFFTEMARTCKPNAPLTIVTDHPTYTNQITKTALEHPAWTSSFALPYYVTEWDNYGTSYFDALWREQGLKIHYMQYTRKP